MEAKVVQLSSDHELTTVIHTHTHTLADAHMPLKRDHGESTVFQAAPN